jgi:hypothetical protein
MKLFRFISFLMTLALLQACTSMPGQKADIDAVIRASGLDTQLKTLQQPLNPEKMDGPLALIPEEWITMVNSTIAQTLQPEQIRASLHSTLEKNLSSAELLSVQKFYESDTGRHVVAVEGGKTYDKISTANSSSSSSSSSNDSATLDALAETTGTGKAISMLAQHGLNDAIDIAVKNNCFGLDKVPFASMVVGVLKKSQLKALRQAVNASVHQQYEELSGDEQARYLGFAKSTAGQKFFNARTDVMVNAAGKTGDALSGQLAQRIQVICKE